jgi:RNA polymerase sigma-70 factor (ECF subfamily)
MAEVNAGTLAEMLDERRHLLEIALWMFGSAETADRIVQETYRRWYILGNEERADIAVPRAWLTRVAGGICLEVLAAAASAHAPIDVPQRGSAAAPALGAPMRWPEPIGLTGHQTRSRPAMLARHDRVARRFAAACETGDTAALKAVLAA